jgi:hypothetical protein
LRPGIKVSINAPKEPDGGATSRLTDSPESGKNQPKNEPGLRSGDKP